MPLRSARQIHTYRGNRLLTQPDEMPITSTELQTHLRLNTGSADELLYLDQLIQEATQEVEDQTGLAFITQQWQLTLDQWPTARENWWDGEREAHIDVIYNGNRQNYASIRIPRYPLQTVDEITVYAEDGTATVVNIADTFDVDTQSIRGRLTIKRGATWPVALRANNAIEIRYTAGYGADPSSVPAPLKRALRNMAAFAYEHRGDGCAPGDAYRVSGAMATLSRYRDIEV